MSTDADLLAAARSDAAAFRELYERYATRIHGYHLRRSGDPEAAHDLTAETFAQAWLSRTRFRDDANGSAGPWLYGIARHVLLVERAPAAHRAARVRAPRHPQPADREPAAEPDERWLDGLDEALASLPEAQQDAIRLRIVDDLTYDEAAARARHLAPRSCARASRAASARSASTSSTRWRSPDDAPASRARRLGDALERAATADLPPPAPPPPPRLPRRLAIAIAVARDRHPRRRDRREPAHELERRRGQHARRHARARGHRARPARS